MGARCPFFKVFYNALIALILCNNNNTKNIRFDNNEVYFNVICVDLKI